MKRFISAITAILSFLGFTSLSAHGKVDLAPIYLNIGVIESGKTINRLNMGGARFDATVQLIEDGPLVFRPSAFFAAGEGNIYSGSAALGFYIPACDWLTFIPSSGATYSHLHMYVDLPISTPYGTLVFPNTKEKFESTSYFIGLDMIIKFNEQHYLTFIIQQAWARTHTTIGDLLYSKGRSSGNNYALVYDYYWNKNWAVSTAAAYNESLSHEKHGIKAFGAKLGISYYF